MTQEIAVEKLSPLEIKELKAQLRELRQELKEVESSGKKFTKDAQGLIEKFFSAFAAVGSWINGVCDRHVKHFYVDSPLHRRRHLYGALTGVNRIIGAMDRRAKNSPIQGFGADCGHTAARIFAIHWHDYLKRAGTLDDHAPYTVGGVECAVHDALFFSPYYKDVLPCMQISQWCATLGVQQYYLEQFDFDFLVPLEIEFELFPHQAELYKWDWTQEGLRECIRKTLQGQAEIGLLKTEEVESVYNEIFSAWENPKLKRWLDKHYPFFGDPDTIR